MPELSFVATDENGNEQPGTVDAASVAEAKEIILEAGLTPVSIDGKSVGRNGASRSSRSGSSRNGASKGGRGSSRGGRGSSRGGRGKKDEKEAKLDKRGRSSRTKYEDNDADGDKKKGNGLSMEIKLPGRTKVKTKELTVFTRQLATLINAGLPLVRGLEVLERQEKNAGLKNALGDMTESIKSGSNFAEALSAHPKIFDKLYVNMVRAGELGGVLDRVLLSLSDFMEKLQKIKGKVKSAMVYPLVVLSMAMLILVFLMVFIIPKFQEIFEDVLGDEGKLPLPTQILIGISEAMINSWYWIVAGIVLFGFLFKTWAQTNSGSALLDRFKLKMPLFGSLILKSGITRMTRTLGTLMESGVPVLQSLTIVRDTAGNAVLSNAMNDVHDAVKEGENMAPPMDNTGIFPPMVISMIEVGEETGELPDMLHRIADNYEEEVDNAVGALTSIIEPLLIVMLAFIVGGIVIALFLPLIELVTNLGG